MPLLPGLRLNFKLLFVPDIISITAIASISPLGNDSNTIWENYLRPEHCFNKKQFGNRDAFAAMLDEGSKSIIENLKKSDTKYKSLDDSVLFAIAASRKAIANAGWKKNSEFGINLGSSRG